jgi:signal transduction histidine kinase
MAAAVCRAIVRALEAFITWWARRDRIKQLELDAAWARRGERYWLPYYGIVLVSSVALWLAALFVASLYVRISTGDFWALAGFESACLTGAGLWSILAVRRGPARAILDWVRAGKPPELAPAAWRAAVQLPMRSIAEIAIWRFYLAAVLPLGLFVRYALGDTWLVAFAAAFALAGAMLTPFVLHYLCCDWFVGPIKRDAARASDPQLGPLRPLASMRWRVLLALTVMNDGTAVIASMLASTGHVSLGTVIVTQTIAFGVAGLIAFGVSILATESIVCPIEDLVAAAETIQSGDLSARVPVVSADELGILSSRFNSMAAELQGARGRLVSAREEERRRVRRDLHDGLGPSLAALVMQLELVTDLLDTDPARVRALVGELKGQTQEAITDIRRLVYELRPPSLDELGLAGAIRENAARLTGGGDGAGVQLTLHVPEAMPQLPAAVEVAAYRIAQEALTNLVRHARASTCMVELSLNGGLELLVSDDGCGIASVHAAGVGLASMRERAAELGGSCTVERGTAGGTLVRAHLPLPEG